MDKNGHYLFNFDVPQTTAIAALIASLDALDPLRTVAKRVVEVLHYLYFPSKISRSVFHTFAEPIVAFFGILCLTINGVPRPVTDVPQICARLQFSMRLRGFHHLFTDFTTTYAPTITATVSYYFSRNRISLTLVNHPQRKLETGQMSRNTSSTTSGNDSDASGSSSAGSKYVAN